MVAEKARERDVLSLNKGLKNDEVIKSREMYGENRFSGGKRRSFFRQFVSNLNDPVIKILLFALGLNLLFLIRGGDIYESIGIGVSVFLATFISTLSEYSSEAAFRRLEKDSEGALVKVVRDGKIREIPSEEIVVGDILHLFAGEKIPCDCVLLHGSLGVDESSMTGESIEVIKSPFNGKDNKALPPSPGIEYALLGGCNILSGEGVARADAVGDGTFLGGVSLEVRQETRESPLRLRLRRLASTISRLGYIAAVLVALAYLVNSFIIDSGHHPSLIGFKLSDVRYIGEKLLHALMLGLTVLVVAVPEGLPLMISVVLSANIKKMARDSVLVRKPVGIEAAGSMNILFTDKTGTLTEGHLTLKEYILGNGEVIFPDGGKVKPRIFENFVLSGIFNSSSELDASGHAVGGNLTDRALSEAVAVYAKELSIKIRVTEKIPFDSEKKYSAVRLSDGRVLIKGAPEILMPYVRFYMDSDGYKRDFNPYRLERELSGRRAEGGRVLLLCESSDMPGRHTPLTLVCAVHLSDRVRKSAVLAAGKLRGAGVHVVMVTGDNIETAEAVARESGLISKDTDICLTSRDMAAMCDMRLRELLPRIAVVARALPSDKSRLVRIAQEAEMVVGMTGDGINDAPALRRADVGFAMGSGTQVAKDAGDIIILDNDLSSIAKAVLYGRGIFKNIRKFITLQLTMNLAAVGVSMIGPFIGIDAPVTVVQMLWINIIMDTLGGIAFAGEHASEKYMTEKPKKRDERILNRYMAGEIITLGAFMIALSLSFLKLPSFSRLFRYHENDLYLLTAFFALFIFTSVVACFCTRSDSLNLFSGLAKNKVFIFVMLAISVIQAAFIYLGGSVLRTLPLTPEELKVPLLLSLTVIPVDFLRKAFICLSGSKNSGY